MKVTTEIVTKWAVFDQFPDAKYECDPDGDGGWTECYLDGTDLDAMLKAGQIRRIIEPEKVKFREWKSLSGKLIYRADNDPIQLLGKWEKTGNVVIAEVITDGE